MSKERELLEKVAVQLSVFDLKKASDLVDEIQELLAQPEQWQPECCICKTNENVEWVGGYQAYRCNSKDCIPL